MTLNMQELVEDLVTSDSAKKSVIDHVTRQVSYLGFTGLEPLTRDGKNYSPKLPSKGVSNLSDEEITDLQADFVVMLAYAGEQASILDIIASDYSIEAKRMRSRVRLKATGTAAEREDKANTHPKVTDLEDNAAAARGTLKIVKDYHNFYEKARGVCSRDVERRRYDFEGSRRDGSIRGKRRRGPHRQSELEPKNRHDR
jgi:hypothetical protein